jgi:hypothetical protein
VAMSSPANPKPSTRKDASRPKCLEKLTAKMPLAEAKKPTEAQHAR